MVPFRAATTDRDRLCSPTSRFAAWHRADTTWSSTAAAGSDLSPTRPVFQRIRHPALVGNHPFVDGNKRIGFAALKVLLARNDYLLEVHVDDAESMVLRVAAGDASRDELLD